MREYRLYPLVPGTNHIKGVVEVVVCRNDTEATEEAIKRINGLDIEIWDGARCVKRLKSADHK
ncbi:MAG TPA: hypothetical protein VGH13_21835 [Xanthobacteraceae bacterium]|jgi:hypothetical protein